MLLEPDAKRAEPWVLDQRSHGAGERDRALLLQEGKKPSCAAPTCLRPGTLWLGTFAPERAVATVTDKAFNDGVVDIAPLKSRDAKPGYEMFSNRIMNAPHASCLSSAFTVSTWKTRAAERFKRICEGLFDRALPLFGVAVGSMYEVELVPFSTSATKLSAASARSGRRQSTSADGSRLSRSRQPCDRSALVARPIRRVLHLDKLATTPWTALAS
jgi:hypothetical protein